MNSIEGELLFSIVIPTKDRQVYLQSCLEFLLDIKSSDFEIIICDNSKDDTLRQFINSRQDSRVKYFYYPDWLSVSENYDKGLEQARGKYVTMIGDDDAISSHTLDVVKWMDTLGIEVLLPKFAVYYWPDITFKYHGGAFSGNLIIPHSSGSRTETATKAELNKCLTKGGTTLGHLPQVYYGVVRRTLLLEVKRISGKFVPGASPDMSVASSLAVLLPRITRIDIALFIAGNSAKSAAGMGAQKTHSGEIEDTPWLPKETARVWTALVPKFWSGPTIWAESFIKAVTAMEHEMLLTNFNYLYLYAKSLVFNPEYKSRTMDAFNHYIKASKQNKYRSLVIVSVYFFLIWSQRLKIFITNRRKIVSRAFAGKIEKTFFNLSNVKEAGRRLDSEIQSQVAALVKHKQS